MKGGTGMGMTEYLSPERVGAKNKIMLEAIQKRSLILFMPSSRLTIDGETCNYHLAQDKRHTFCHYTVRSDGGPLWTWELTYDFTGAEFIMSGYTAQTVITRPEHIDRLCSTCKDMLCVLHNGVRYTEFLFDTIGEVRYNSIKETTVSTTASTRRGGL